MKNYLFGPNGLATKIVHTRYLSRWIVMGIDVVLSTLVTVFAYWLIRFVREEPIVWSWVAYLALLAAVISACLLYTSPSPRDGLLSRMPSSA